MNNIVSFFLFFFFNKLNCTSGEGFKILYSIEIEDALKDEAFGKIHCTAIIS